MKLNNLHQTIYNKLAPVRTARTCSSTQLINPRIEKVKKRRDRFYKKYRKYGNEEDLNMAKLETKRLKKVIKKETTLLITRKSQSPNTDSFWNLVAELQGRKVRTKIDKITEDGTEITNDKAIADSLANFFQAEIDNLRKNHPPIDQNTDLIERIKNRRIIENFTSDEIINALNSLKPKMSTGIDDIPTKIVKLSSPAQRCF